MSSPQHICVCLDVLVRRTDSAFCSTALLPGPQTPVCCLCRSILTSSSRDEEVEWDTQWVNDETGASQEGRVVCGG